VTPSTFGSTDTIWRLRGPPAHRAAAVEAEALAAAFDETGEQPDRAKGAERFQYDLTLVRGAERRTVRLREGAVPDARCGRPSIA
jgi:hypothetical protein